MLVYHYDNDLLKLFDMQFTYIVLDNTVCVLNHLSQIWGFSRLDNFRKAFNT